MNSYLILRLHHDINTSTRVEVNMIKAYSSKNIKWNTCMKHIGYLYMKHLSRRSGRHRRNKSCIVDDVILGID